MGIDVVVADDHRMFRDALRGALASEPDIRVVAEAGTGSETMELLRRHRADVLVLDIGLPDANGIDVARQVREAHREVGIVALSGYSDRVFVEESLKAGMQGYVVKSAGIEELVQAIRTVAGGQRFLCAEVTGLLTARMSGAPSVAPPMTVLGRREQEILRLLAGGLRSAQIARELGIAPATVEVHRRNIKRKLGLNSTADLTRYAVREGLVQA